MSPLGPVFPPAGSGGGGTFYDISHSVNIPATDIQHFLNLETIGCPADAVGCVLLPFADFEEISFSSLDPSSEFSATLEIQNSQHTNYSVLTQVNGFGTTLTNIFTNSIPTRVSFQDPLEETMPCYVVVTFGSGTGQTPNDLLVTPTISVQQGNFDPGLGVLTSFTFYLVFTN